MKKTWFNFFMGLFALLFAGGVAEARSKGMKEREHHRHHPSVASYNVGGIVNELADGETIVLLNNGRDDFEITANGVFTFSTPVSDLTTYDVTVLTQPDNQICRVNNGSGTINGADVTNITIRCSIFSVAIAAGGDHAVALKSDGTVWTWGGNNYGQLGDGTTTRSSTPVQVIGLTDVDAIAAGWGHGIALKSDGTIWTWGTNKYGRLGLGLSTTTTTSCSDLDIGDDVYYYQCSTTPVPVLVEP